VNDVLRRVLLEPIMVGTLTEALLVFHFHVNEFDSEVSTI